MVNGIIIPESWRKTFPPLRTDVALKANIVRDIGMESDPKMKDLRRSLLEPEPTSPLAQTLRSSTGLGAGTRSLRDEMEGNRMEAHERLIRRLANESSRSSSSLPRPVFTSPSKALSSTGFVYVEPEIPDADSPADFGNMTMSMPMSRLMSDMDLAAGPYQRDMLKATSSALRCRHLDRMHRWFLENGGKCEASDEPFRKSTRPAPAFSTFDKDDRVMVGSLRVEPSEQRYAPAVDAKPRQHPRWMCKSMSSPSLKLEQSSTTRWTPTGR